MLSDRLFVRFACAAFVLAAVAACGGGGSSGPGGGSGAVVPSSIPATARPSPAPTGTQAPVAGALQHLVFIVQENRSFDEYFGTYPGANGIPSSPPCQVDPWYPNACDTPYPNHVDSNQGGPYMYPYQVTQVDGGKMDGFVLAKEQELGPQCAPGRDGRLPRKTVTIDDPEAGGARAAACEIDVMGYHDGTDVPNYWAYAQNYVLLDNFYESIESFSLPSHLAMFSGWSASCKNYQQKDVNTCVAQPDSMIWNYSSYGKPDQPYLWTDITYLLHANGVSWKVYNDGVGIDPQSEPFGFAGVEHIWNVLPGFETVNEDGELSKAGLLISDYLKDASAGTLPAVSWILPAYQDSEHPQASIADGQTYTTNLINAVMQGPAAQWNSTAIFIVWDDIGGFYDHQPPGFNFDSLGLGMRVSSLIVSPLAKRGVIDHRLCSTDCYLTLIENTFLNGERISQAGRPDPRAVYRDQQTAYGDLRDDFDLAAKPRRPMVLRAHPMTLLHR
jgi:phospholipase C